MRIDKNTVFFLASFSLKILVQFLNLFLIAQYINKQDYGEYNYALIFVNIFLVFSFGIIDGLNIEIPFHQKNNPKLVYDDISSSYAYFLILFSITILLSILIFPFVGASIIGFLFVLIMSIFTLFEYYILSVYRGTDKLKVINRANIIFTILQIVTIFLIVQYGLKGLYIKMMLCQVIYIAYLFYYFDNKFSFKINFNILKEIIKIGFPLYAFHYITTIGVSLDKMMLAKYFDKNILGVYSYGAIIYMFYLIINKLLISYYYPQFVGYISSFNKPLLEKKYIEHTVYTIIGATIFCLIIYFLSDFLFHRYLSKYVESLPVFKIFALIGIFSISNFSSYTLITSFKNNKVTYIYNSLLVIPLYLCPIICLLFFKFNLVNLSISILIANILMFIISQLFVYYFFKTKYPELMEKRLQVI